MLRALTLLLIRALFEVAAVLFVIAGVLLLLTYRLARSLVTDTDNPIDQLLAKLLAVNSMVPRRRPPPDDDADDEQEIAA